MTAEPKSQDLLPNLSKVKRFAISESGFVFDPASGHSFTVNETGLQILHGLQQGQGIDAIRERLASEFAVDAQTLDRDLSEFILALKEQLGQP